IFGAIYLHLVTIPLLYGPEPLHGLFSYEWKGGLTGLAYLGAGLGIVIGTFICTKYLNRSYTWLAERNPRQSNKPESRMLFLQIGMLIVPFGLIIFAWTAEKQQHWALPLLGAAIFASGIFMAFLCVQTYLVDVYGEYSASALAAMIAARSIGSCMFSVVGFQLYVSLGYGCRGTMVVAFVCLAALPVPMFVYKSGPRLRSNRRQML
ncbi:MAG: hypothetical protein LQ345_006863, partial [Seirophora villosa]